MTAWQQRRLVFRKETLTAIAAEFNRYNRMKIVIEDASVERAASTALSRQMTRRS